MITQIRMQNFRGVEDRVLKFGPQGNKIEGPNESGKSTAKEAISFGYFGADSRGTKNPDHLIQQGKDFAVVAISTEKATIVRKKRRGQTSTVELQREGFPDIKMNQTELGKLLGLDFDLFASAYQVGYFMSLTDAQRIAAVNAAVNLDRKALFERKLRGVTIPWKLIKLINPLTDADAVARERRILNNQLQANHGAVHELEIQINSPSSSLTPDEMAKLEEEVARLQGRVNLYEAYQTQARDHRVAYTRYQNSLASFNTDQTKGRLLRSELASLGPSPASDESGLLSQLQALAEERKLTETYVRAVPAAPQYREELAEQSCPRCGQMVGEKLKESISLERTQQLNAYNQLNREVADHNQKVRDTLAMLSARILEGDEVLQKRRTQAATYNEKIAGIQKQLRSLPPEDAQAPVATLAPEAPFSKEEADLDSKALQTAWARLEGAKLFLEKSAGMVEKVQTLKEEIAAQATSIGNLEVIEGVLKRLPLIELEETIQRIQLSGVEVVIVEGELKVSVNGVPYHSLSDGRRMKTDLLWCQCIQGLVANPPKFYFCDNADLVDSFHGLLPADAQIFFANVRKDLTELQVVQL